MQFPHDKFPTQFDGNVEMESGVDYIGLLKTRYTIIIFNTNSSLGKNHINLLYEEFQIKPQLSIC